jgi:RND family efflux transporter MFP subunit
LVDQNVGAWEADKAATAAALANVKQLEAQEGFKTLVAPFDGIVTSRSTDIGALISVGSPTDVPLFTVADEHRLRIYVHVPQNSAALVTPGQEATFTVPQFPGTTFTATLATTSEAVDAASGTLLAEFQTDNAGDNLKPGEYAQMRFILTNPAGSVVLPSSALMFRDTGMAVATVDAQNRIVMKPITIGRDLGQTVEVSDGLSRSDRVVDNPPDALRPGDVVRIAEQNSSRN